MSFALRTLITLHITPATGERIFSKLKIRNNYLRTVLTQTQVNGLAMLAIGYELTNKLKLYKFTLDCTQKDTWKEIALI